MFPQEVREPRYCAHLVIGVEMLLSMSQWPPLTCRRFSVGIPSTLVVSALRCSYMVVVTAGADTIDDEGADLLDAGKLGGTHDGVR